MVDSKKLFNVLYKIKDDVIDIYNDMVDADSLFDTLSDIQNDINDYDDDY